jgi:hypothetical protein
MKTLSSVLLHGTYDRADDKINIMKDSSDKMKFLKTLEMCYMMEDVDSVQRLLALEDPTISTNPYIVSAISWIFDHCIASISTSISSQLITSSIVNFFIRHRTNISCHSYNRIVKLLVTYIYREVHNTSIQNYINKHLQIIKEICSYGYCPYILTDIVMNNAISIESIKALHASDINTFFCNFVKFCVIFSRYDVIQMIYDYCYSLRLCHCIIFKQVSRMVQSAQIIQKRWQTRKLKYWIAHIAYSKNLHPSIACVIYNHAC